jgi:hypothetical protein
LIFVSAFLLSSGKLGKQSSRFRAANDFFFGNSAVLYQNPKSHQPNGRRKTILCFSEVRWVKGGQKKEEKKKKRKKEKKKGHQAKRSSRTWIRGKSRFEGETGVLLDGLKGLIVH